MRSRSPRCDDGVVVVGNLLAAADELVRSATPRPSSAARPRRASGRRSAVRHDDIGRRPAAQSSKCRDPSTSTPSVVAGSRRAHCGVPAIATTSSLAQLRKSGPTSQIIAVATRPARRRRAARSNEASRSRATVLPASTAVAREYARRIPLVERPRRCAGPLRLRHRGRCRESRAFGLRDVDAQQPRRKAGEQPDDERRCPPGS